MSSKAAAAASVRTHIVVRDAGEDDVPAVQEIYAHHVANGRGSFEETPPDLAEMQRRRTAIQERGLPYLVAEIGGEMAGFAYAAPYRTRPAYRNTVEDSVYVEPRFLGQGVGRALLGEVIERSRAAGYRQMVSVIGDSDNQASISLHERLGFRHVGVLTSVGWKFGGWVDTVLMQRALGDGDAAPPGKNKAK